MGAALGGLLGGAEPDEKDVAALARLLDDEESPTPGEGGEGDDAGGDPSNERTEGEEEEEEPAPKKEPPAKDDAEGEEGEGEPAAIETIGQLAEVFGTKPDEVLSTLRVDLGEERGEVTLQDLVDHFQQPPDLAPIQEVTSRYEALSAETADQSRKIFEQTLGAARALQALIVVDESEIEAAKRDGDHARALELVTLNQRRQSALADAVDAMRKQESFFGEKRKKDDDAYHASEFQSLLRVMPKWRNEAVGRAAMKQIKDHALAMGFKEEEIESLADHRAIRMAWEASEYGRLMKKVKGTAKKKVLTLPAHLPRVSTSAPTRREADQKDRKSKFARLRRSGDERDAAALIEGLID